ncbi:MAG TPA: LuxR C-terminal-related transcriptional regulator, partial [Candidatus Limnocylindrales bacterium]|nr:LuxR C-terminal-related transcriptional regulator [Candidatus Limnocylindrales bacterium]
MTRTLSDPEAEVLRLFGAGYSAREIAQKIGMAETTVQWLIGHLVAERGGDATQVLANRLAGRRAWLAALRPVAVPMGLAAIVGLAIAILSASGTMRGPWFAPSESAVASPAPSAAATEAPITSSPPAGAIATIPPADPDAPDAAPPAASGAIGAPPPVIAGPPGIGVPPAVIVPPLPVSPLTPPPVATLLPTLAPTLPPLPGAPSIAPTALPTLAIP